MAISFLSNNKYVALNTTWYRRNKRGVFNIIKWTVGVLGFSLLSFLIICRFELNPRLYLRQWIAPSRRIPEPISPTCFRNQQDYLTPYSKHKKHLYNFIPGIPIWEENTCYEYASLIQPIYDSTTTTTNTVIDNTTTNNTNNKNNENNEIEYYNIPHTIYHTTWSKLTDHDFTPVHLATIKSFISTQPLNSSEMIIWVHSNDELILKEHPLWETFTKVRYQVYDPASLINNTIIQDYLNQHNVKQQPNELIDLDSFILDPEILRLLVLYQHGGVWFDINTFFVRDLSPLLEHEWIGQGKCQSSMVGNPFDGELWHFYDHSPYLCELLYGATTYVDRLTYNDIKKNNYNNNNNNNNDYISKEEMNKIKNQQKKTTIIKNASELPSKMKSVLRGSGLYQRVYRNIIREGIKPWSTTPWCFTNPTQCKPSNSLQSPFENRNFKPEPLRQVFAFRFQQPKLSVALAPSGSIYKYLQQTQRWEQL
ncbi:unnamed protein product [Cunninghamella blakesleeana]